MMPVSSEHPQSQLAGTVTIVGDIVGPVLPEEYWESLLPANAVKPPPPPSGTSS